MSTGLRDLVARLRLDTTQFQNGLRGLAKNLKVVGATLSVASAGMAAAIRQQLNAADEMSKNAQRLGVPIETLSKLSHAADMSGVSIETLGTGVRKLSQRMADAKSGNKAAATLFDSIGVSAMNADGSLRATEDVLADVAEVLSKMPDGAEKTALAMDVFGKSGTDLLPMLNGGKKSLADMMREAESLGIVLDAKTGKAAEDFNDDLARIATSVRGLVIQFMAHFAPTLREISKRMVELTKGFRDLSPETRALAAKFALVAMAAGPLLLGLAAIILPLRAVLSAMKALALVALANPLVLIATAAVVAAGLIYYHWGSIKAWFADIWAGIKQTASDLWTGITTLASDAVTATLNAWTGIKEYFAVVWMNVKDAFTEGWQKIKDVTAQWVADFLEIGGLLVEGLKQGILEKWDAMVAWFKGLAEGLSTSVRGWWRVQSPSKVFHEIGGYLTEGLALGISSNQPMVDSAMDGIADSINGKGQSLAERMEDFKSAAQSAFVGFVTGAKTAREALSQLLSSMAQTFANKAFSGLWDALFPKFADGAAFSGGRVTAFASGGIVSGATAFRMQSGLGVMGEAGPEAIMPLTRGRGGKLGVQASGGGGVLQISLGPGLQAEWLQEAEGRSIQITQAGIAQNNKAMPEMVKAISARPRVR